MKILPRKFSTRDDLVSIVREISPWVTGGPSCMHGGRMIAEMKLSDIDPINYANTRNFGNGKITKLSPYIHHGILTLSEVKNHALKQCSQPEQVEKFIQELAWRDFWSRVLCDHPEWAWQDAEPYKTGFTPDDYSDILPPDIEDGKTGISSLDFFIKELVHTGYIHNHARMYLASYIIHFRRIKWQIGARWFLHHLLDGDVASNNLSWQWVASTFSHKPYIFNLENIHKYFGSSVDTSPENNIEINKSYEKLASNLFPKIMSKV